MTPVKYEYGNYQVNEFPNDYENGDYMGKMLQVLHTRGVDGKKYYHNIHIIT